MGRRAADDETRSRLGARGGRPLGKALRIAAPAALCAALLTATANDRAAAQGPDLSRYTLVLEDEFDSFMRYDGTSGVWATRPRRQKLATNGPRSVFLSRDVAAPDGTRIGLDPFRVEDGKLKIDAGVIPEAALPAVRDALRAVGQDKVAERVRYYTGMISTSHTLGQTYGYFEIRAKVPQGRGHWPAFWLAPAGLGWPPEIDVFEAYGRGVGERTQRDDVFNVAVFFDALDPEGNPTHGVDLTNPFAASETGDPEEPNVRERPRSTRYQFAKKINARERFGAEIYDQFYTYAAEWTPQTITFYFGKERASLQEVYKTPTPDDLHDNMILIANGQVTSHWNWNPRPRMEERILSPDNAFEIDAISVYALRPEHVVALPDEAAAAAGEGAILVDDAAANKLVGTPDADLVALAGGQDFVELGGGADTVFLTRGLGNAFLEDFSSDDRLVLDGFSFADGADVLERLTQVGEDVWLPDGIDIADPQTIIVRNARVNALTADNFVVRWPVTRKVWRRFGIDAEPRIDDDADAWVEAGPGASRLSDRGAPRDETITLKGSREGDEYRVSRASTRIVEAEEGGVDTVYASGSFTLPDHVENLVAVRARRRHELTGNALGNRILGNHSGQELRGGPGDDLVVTGGGPDTVHFAAGDGHDVVTGFSADDRVVLSGIGAPEGGLATQLRASGDDTILSLAPDASITFLGVSPDALADARIAFDPTGRPAEGRTEVPHNRPSGVTRARGAGDDARRS